MRLVSRLAIFLALTMLTQIGGIAYAGALVLGRLTKRQGFATHSLLTIALYTASTFASHLLVPMTGRVPLPCAPEAGAELAVQSPIYCMLNRNYVTPQTYEAAKALAVHMGATFPGTKTLVLDANFPFIDGFPLLPHLSHADGRKIDIAFYYERNGTYLPSKTRSPIGYFAFEQPEPGDPQPCLGRNDWLTLRWDLNWLQWLFPSHQLEKERTAEALRWLASEGDKFGVEKIFVELHIALKLGATGGNVRFQGCRAARHDDHMHFQVR
jgi:hypothetical protein